MITNIVKTVFLFGVLTLLLIYASKRVHRYYGIYVGIVLSVMLNLLVFFYSDQLILSMHRLLPLSTQEYSWVYTDAQDLTQQMNIPLPKLWMSDMPIANAFAVGRNPENAAVVFTSDLLEMLEPEEVRGILAHELSHIKNRDTLLTTVASVMAGAIGYFGYILRQGAFKMHENEPREEVSTPLADFLLSFILPIGATLLRLAISRSREFDADETGAYYSRTPLVLASALEKLKESKHDHQSFVPVQHPMNYMTEALYIINPFTTTNPLLKLLSTHPPVEERIRRLKEIHQNMMQQGQIDLKKK